MSSFTVVLGTTVKEKDLGTLMKIYHGKCMVYHGVLKQVNHGKYHGKYHGILWNTMVYFHKGQWCIQSFYGSILTIGVGRETPTDTV